MKFLDSYGRNQQKIHVGLLLTSSTIFTCTLFFGVSIFAVPFFFVIFIIFMAFAIMTEILATKELHPYNVLRVAKISYDFNFLALAGILLFVPLVFLPVLGYELSFISEETAQFLNAASLWLIIFFTFNFFQVVFSLIRNSFVNAKLYFIVSLECLENQSFKEKQERYNLVGKNFVALSKALSYSAKYIGEKFPINPDILDVQSYYNYAYLIALDGNQQDIITLRANITKLDDALRSKNLRQFLVAMQHLKGNTANELTSTYELSKLFRTLPPFSVQLIELLKKYSPVLTLIATVATVIALYPQIAQYFIH